MYIPGHEHIYLHAFTCTYVHAHTSTYVQTYARTHVHTCIRTYTYSRAYLRALHRHIRTQARARAQAHVRTYVHTQMRVRTRPGTMLHMHKRKSECQLFLWKEMSNSLKQHCHRNKQTDDGWPDVKPNTWCDNRCNIDKSNVGFLFVSERSVIADCVVSIDFHENILWTKI